MGRVDDLGKALEQVGRQVILPTGRQAVHEAVDDLLAESRDEIPYDQGDLSNSGLAATEIDGDQVHGAVGYDTPYAVIQHEAEEFQHQDGRKAQYLGDPLRANANRYLDHIAAAIRGVL